MQMERLLMQMERRLMQMERRLMQMERRLMQMERLLMHLERRLMIPSLTHNHTYTCIHTNTHHGEAFDDGLVH
jgi:Mg2+ and Co2+ transporter CorA